ncbi:arylsulfatase [Chitinophaga pendula]|uniref:arylsulfatase n=1 Tax=Chitinophaga TaxID=79328 RepID=UPI000BAF3421|nr:MULTISPECIES: arylsulfatase [Chitinophaga]ASZ13968.1 N-acetylgalactosamine-6-sulfatase [Chitinophaga sp. MD30]UCJ08409.1 arylsulfatase [Chitinophaga pendula]
MTYLSSKANTWLLCLLAPASLWAQPKQRSAPAKPNIIYIYADDLGYGELGAYGQQKIQTPHLDRIAAEGVRFTDHYTGTPVCAPARCMLLTGRHAGHSYIRGNYELGGFTDSTEGGQMPLPEGTFTIGHLLQKAGYTTAAIGKWGLGMANTTGSPNSQGFDYFYGYLDQKQAHNFYPTHLWENDKKAPLNNDFFLVHSKLPPGETDTAAFNHFKGKEYAIDKMAEKTLAFIRQHKNKPFFLYLPYTGPHVALQAPDEAVRQYAAKFGDQPYRGEKGYAPTLYPRATYAAMITYFDKQIGRIMALLKELNLDHNTVVMFSSDNGPTFDVGGVDTEFFNSTAGLRGRKEDLYEGGIREPFIARWPGSIPAGKVTNLISSQIDMMATLAAIAGIPAPPSDGISLLPAMQGRNNQQQQHPFLYFEFPEKNGQVAVRIGRWKGVRTNMKKDRNSPWELYDLDNDRAETTNIAAQHPDIIRRMEAIMKQEHRPAHIREWEFIDPKLEKRS